MSSTKIVHLIEPYGGCLVVLIPTDEKSAVLHRRAGDLPSIQISARAVCDLELIANGAFSPLEGFMGQKDYESVVNDMRLDDGTLIPIPVTLPVTLPPGVSLGQAIALRNSKNNLY